MDLLDIDLHMIQPFVKKKYIILNNLGVEGGGSSSVG